jgi:excisionase family DNA binding protein
MSDAHLTPDEVAMWLRLTRRKVLDLYRSGELPGIKLGHRTIVFERAEVEKFIARRRTGHNASLDPDGPSPFVPPIGGEGAWFAGAATALRELADWIDGGAPPDFISRSSPNS